MLQAVRTNENSTRLKKRYLKIYKWTRLTENIYVYNL